MVDLRLKLPFGFLDEEVRWDYTISHKMKEIWAVELDLLTEFDRVCRKYDIRYCADGGTLLGAVRHKGFIPWDNDIDLAMLRSDFETLNAVASKEFRAPYFWQTEETDPGSARGHAQLRNSDTTAILRSEYVFQRHNDFNQGIFIDIFPFDNLPDDSEKVQEQDRQRLELIREYRKILTCTDHYYPQVYADAQGKRYFEIKKRLRHLKYRLTGADYQKPYRHFLDVCRRYDNDPNCEYVANLSIGVPLCNTTRYREDFDALEYADFEFIKIPIFRAFDRELKFMYGENYMTPVRGTETHGAIIFDTKRPYTEYLKKRDRKN